MQMQNNQTSSNREFIAPQETQSVEQGKWMYFNEATSATNKSEKTLKRYIKKGELKWRRMGKQSNSPVQVWVTAGFLQTVVGELDQRLEDPDIFESDAHDVDFSPSSEQDNSDSDPLSKPSNDGEHKHTHDGAYDTLIKNLVGEFATHLDRQKEVALAMQRELEEKNLQLRLLPDLQKQLAEKEIQAHLEKSSLEKQIEALKLSVEKQQELVTQLRLDSEERDRISEELQNERSILSKKAEEGRIEREQQDKLSIELQQENDRLRAETERLKAKPSVLNWLLGRKG